MRTQSRLFRNGLGILLTLAIGVGPWVRAQDPAPAPANPPPSAEEPEKDDAKAADNEESPAAPVLRSSREMVRVGSDGTVAADEEVREMVVVLGSARMDGRVRHGMVVVCGDAEVNGNVGQQLVVVGGDLKLGPKAWIQRDVVVVGGGLDRAPGARIDGQLIHPGKFLPSFGSVGRWFRSGLLLGRPLPPQVGLVWWVVGTCLIVYLFVALLFPRPVEVCAGILDAKPLQSFFVGLLGFAMVALLLLLLGLTVVGFVLWPFVGLAMVGAMLLGKTATFNYIGLQVLRRVNPEAGAGSLLAFFLGCGLVCLLYMVPVLGFVAWAVLLTMAFGGASLAVIESFRKNGKNGQGNPAPMPEPSPLTPAATPAGPDTSGFGGAPVMPLAAAPDAAGGAGPAPAATPIAPLAIPQASPYAAGLSPGGGLAPADYASLQRVGFWRRFGATLLDFVAILLLTVKVFPLFPFVWLAYHVGMWTWRGTTVGGSVCGIKIVREDGRALDFGAALVRSLATIFSALALFVGFFWAGWSAERQAWHDKIAGTIVVRVPKGVPLI